MLLLLIAFVATGFVLQRGASDLRLVNMIPRALSWEKSANHEPWVAVNPASPNVMAATAHNIARHFCRTASHAPVLLSVNGGSRWWVVCALSAVEGQNVQDGTVQFSGDGTALFAGTLQSRAAKAGDTTTGPVVDAYIAGIRESDLPSGKWTGIPKKLADWPDSKAIPPIGILFQSDHTDQPSLATAVGGTEQIVAVGANDYHMWSDDMADICRSGSVYVSSNPFVTGSFVKHCVSKRISFGPTPAVRTAVHRDGTVYAVFYRPVIDGNSVDVVVVRADPGELDSANPFDALRDLPDDDADDTAAGQDALDCDRHDGKPGIRVATCMVNPVDYTANMGFGQERRRQSQLSIAVHPTTSEVVYIAWASSTGAVPPRLQLHVQRSADRGVTWSPIDGLVIPDATNPSLAVASDGAVGVLYQQLSSGSCPGSAVRWSTRLEVRSQDLNTELTRDLASVAACTPAAVGGPYIGDYIRLQAVGRNFYGVFSASNDLETGSFAAGFTFQRRHSGGTLKDNGGNPVGISIDPFFFKLTR